MTIETYGQRYRITWSAYNPGGKLLDDGSLTVKVTKPRVADYVDAHRHKQRIVMNIRAQAQQTADAYLKRDYPNYRKAAAHVLHITAISEEDG